MRLLFLALCATISVSTAALAEQQPLPPAGHTIINLSVEEYQTLPQDTLHATLQYEVEGTVATTVQDEINKTVARALDSAKPYNSVKTSTGSYRVRSYNETERLNNQPPYKTKTTKKWKGQQTLNLQSTDFKNLLDLMGHIQGLGFTVQDMSYSLSRQKSDAVQDALLQQALKNLETKAALTARALGKTSYQIINIDVNGASPRPTPVYAKALMESAMSANSVAMSAPVAAADDTDINLHLNASILLKP